MSDPTALQPAANAARINANLMQNYYAAGRPMFQSGIGYASGRLGQIAAGAGLPSYVESGYNAARAGVTEGAIQAAAAARGRARGPAEVSAYRSPLAGAAVDAARERAGIGISRAGARITEQLGLMKQLSGGSASATDLSAGFGALGNRSIRSLEMAGDPTYGAVVGGLSGILGAYGNVQSLRRGTPLNNPSANFAAMGYNPEASAGLGALYSMPAGGL